MCRLRMILSAAVLSILVPAFSADIIIESRAEGKNYSSYKETAGEWVSSNTPATTAKSGAQGLSDRGKVGSRKYVINPDAPAPADKVVATARFTPQIAEAGNYHVYVTFPRAANASPVTFLIKSAAGEDRQQLTMDGWGAQGASNADKWIEIGTYPFSPEGDQYVELQVTGASHAADSRNPVQAYADAMRFSTEPLETSKPKKAAPADGGKSNASGTNASLQAPELQWKTSIGAARAEAGNSGRKILVFFFSPSSSRSTDYEENVLSEPKVRQAIAAGYIPVKINMDTDGQLATQLGVFRAGTINIYDAGTGANVLQISDTPQSDELISRLN